MYSVRIGMSTKSDVIERDITLHRWHPCGRLIMIRRGHCRIKMFACLFFFFFFYNYDVFGISQSQFPNLSHTGWSLHDCVHRPTTDKRRYHRIINLWKVKTCCFFFYKFRKIFILKRVARPHGQEIKRNAFQRKPLSKRSYLKHGQHWLK